MNAASHGWRQRISPVLYWTLPSLVVLLVFWRGLFSWFQQDDFPWLRFEVRSLSDFWRMLVEPRPHGTIRPLSERLFFLVFRRLFDLDAFPYRVFVFLTQFVNLALLAAVARRLAGSRLAGAVAALAWGLNMTLLTPMVWTLAYNQILCSFFYLAALLLFLQHVETGRWSFYAWQCAAFLLGFGALETIVAYPAALLVYCLLAARPHAWKALPLCVPSGLYVAAHLWWIPKAAPGPYAMHLDASIFATLWNYWSWALGAAPYARVTGIGSGVALALVLALTLTLLLALAMAPRPQRRIGLFGLAWFVLALGPVLPLRDHATEYYATIPAIGLALAVAAAVEAAPRAAAAAWLSVYLWCSVGYVRNAIHPIYQRSHDARQLLDGIREIRARHPNKSILLEGVTDYLFWAVLYDEGPLTAGIRRVYLAPTNQGIADQPGLRPVELYQLPPAATLRALAKGEAVVYEIAGNRLQNITKKYSALAPALIRPGPPRRVDVGEPDMAGQLGAGWYWIHDNHRWMGRRAELRMAAPRSAAERLRIHAIHSDQPAAGPVRLTVSVNGIRLGQVEIRDNRSGVHSFSLPAEVVGLPEITVTLETDRTFKAPGDTRDLGLAFGILELI